MAVRNTEVQQALCINIFVVYYAFGDLVGEFVNDLDRLEHGFLEYHGVKAVCGLRAWVNAHALKCVEEKRKRPLAVGSAFDTQVPLVCKSLCQPPLDVFPAAKTAIVHPHEASMYKGVAIGLRSGSLGGGPDVCENEG